MFGVIHEAQGKVRGVEGHSDCVRAVTQEVSSLAGATNVAVNLASGELTISNDCPLDDRAVKAAVDEAGFAVVP